MKIKKKNTPFHCVSMTVASKPSSYECSVTVMTLDVWRTEGSLG